MDITILETGMTLEEQIKIAKKILKEDVIPKNKLFNTKNKTNRLQTASKQNA